MKESVFDPQKVLLRRFKKMWRPTPDFKLVKDGKLRGYCEMKSPSDRCVFDFPKDLELGEIREEVRPAGPCRA